MNWADNAGLCNHYDHEHDGHELSVADQAKRSNSNVADEIGVHIPATYF